MQDAQNVEIGTLLQLFEATQKKDQDARRELEAWFDSRIEKIREGMNARREIGSLAYLVAERRARRKLARGGQYDDLQNDPGSIAGGVWQRLGRFFRDVESGKRKSLDDFICRLNVLIKFVFIDLVRKRDAQGVPTSPFVDEVHSGQMADNEGDRAIEDDPEWLQKKRELLQQIIQVLPPSLFLVVILKDFCGFHMTEIADMLHLTTFLAKKEYQKARDLIGRKVAKPEP